MTGSIKDYTPNFEFIIPEFNITGWHDYLEENFRSIDALFYNLFGINNFKGQWKNSTVYNVNDVVFVGEDTDYSGRLVKVLVQHTTAGTGNFTEFFTANPSYYELFADASTAQIFAQEAKDWATKMDGSVESGLYSSKYYADIVNSLSTEITALYNIRNDIQNVNLISTEVVDVSNIKNSVQSVANNTTNINTVVNNSSNITTVAESIANVNTNATNINAINTNASSISDIQNAYSNAQSALNSKNLAQEWATGANLVDNTDYSAKYYANLAKSEAESVDANNIVHKTGNEIITGSKTFTGTLGIPSDNLIAKQDNALEGGQLNLEKPTNSSLTGNANIDIYENRMRFLGHNSSNNYTTPLYLDLETNIAYATASDATNSVVTTTGISKSENGYFKLGNGLIIQWGWHNDSGSTLTFPTPFTSTNYSVTANYRKQSSSGSGVGHVNFYPTSTTSCYFNSQGGDFQWIAIGY